MAYLEHFEHDVFISYAHIDNAPDREGDQGWVESFERALRIRSLKRFGREVDVWRDPALDRSQRFDPVIESAVHGSAVVLSLISRAYLESAYCQQELDWFTQKAAQEPAGLTVDHHVRVFPVLLYNVATDEWPEACRATSGFRFHDARDHAFGKPLRPDHDEFTDQLCVVVDELYTVLTAIAKASPREPARDAASRSQTVFLAEVSDEMRRDRRQLQQRLEREQIQVIRGPTPEDPARHEASVVDALERSELAIHLLGSLPGRPVDEDEPEKTYPIEQVRIGFEHARSQLVVLPPGLESGQIEEPDYASFLQAIQDRRRDAERLEVLKAGPAQLADEVIAKLKRLRSREPSGAPGPSGNAFVDLHVNDLPFAGDLVGYLHEHDLPAVTIPSADLDPAAGLNLFEQNLRTASFFIVVFGMVARSWVEQRLNEAFKLILSNQLHTRIGVYLAPPHKSASEAAFPPFFQVMNNTDQFDPKTLDALLRDPPESA